MDKERLYQKLKEGIIPILEAELVLHHEEDEIVTMVQEIISEHLDRYKHIPAPEAMQPGELWLRWPKGK